jgi:hypothetical protein
MAFTEAQIDAACAAWDRVWMGCAYQGMARDAIRAALIAAMDLVERHDVAAVLKENIIAAARVLIDMVRVVERDEGERSTHAELDFEIDLAAGGKETWTITVERTASCH